MLFESDLIPFTASLPKGNKVLVLSPHPDDETLGCGGTIRLLVQLKIPVKVIFLTSGDKADPSHKLSHIVHKEISMSKINGDSKEDSHTKHSFAGVNEEKLSGESHSTAYALLSEKEAVNALRVLGVSDYEFLRFPDRDLDQHYESVLGRLLTIISNYTPDTIYSPSTIELNPDHRTTAELSLEIQRRMTEHKGSVPINILFYEIATPLRPNMLVDVTSVYTRKKRAIKKYKSQLKIRDYFKHIAALNAIRSLTVDGTLYIEAFWHIDEAASRRAIAQWLGYESVLDKNEDI